ncbi:T9SS type A sorting domain-containing protein [candidate division KSB1 bacterium]|nr:T9SS type A sorting domain-containing protein [candidate division KSB1 bacterium]
MCKKILGSVMCALAVAMAALPNRAAAQALTLTARQAVERAEPLANQWAADAALILVGTAIAPGMFADGKAEAWACGYYSAAKDSARNYYAALAGPVSYEPKSPQNYPSLKPLGANWIDSDAAGQSAEARGGASFRAAHSDANVQAALYWGATDSQSGKGESGLWWWFAYFSSGASALIKFELSAFTLSPRPQAIVTVSKPPLGQDILLIAPPTGRLAVLNFSAGALDSVRLEAFAGVSPDTTGARKAVLRYYQLSAYPDTASFTATLTLYYAQEEFILSGIHDEAGLKLYRNAGEGWELIGGTVDSASNFVVAAGVTKFSTWAMANPNDQPLAVSERSDWLPAHFALTQNYPNPFNPNTTIAFTLPKASIVTLKIYNLLGEEVATLVAEKLPAGKHQRVWEAKGFAGGVYLYQLRVGDFSQVRKMSVIR